MQEEIKHAAWSLRRFDSTVLIDGVRTPHQNPVSKHLPLGSVLFEKIICYGIVQSPFPFTSRAWCLAFPSYGIFIPSISTMPGGSERLPVSPLCTEVTPDCPVEGTLYGYYPNLGANAFFAAFFGFCFLIQLGLGIKYRTWTYLIALGFGCVGEMIGYIGRIMLNENPYAENGGFEMQICCLIISPAFISAGVYLVLKHIVMEFGEQWSRLKPKWYTWIFITADIVSLVLQAIGGGTAATADPGSKALDTGTDLMIAGIVWQVVSLLAFGYFLCEYTFRTWRRQSELSLHATTLICSTKFRLFIGAVIIAYLTIFVRCVYRIPELTGGWGSPLMRNEVEFIVLEGVMIVIAVMALTVFHPGYCFPVLGKGGKKEEPVAGLRDDSSTEKLEQH